MTRESEQDGTSPTGNADTGSGVEGDDGPAGGESSAGGEGGPGRPGKKEGDPGRPWGGWGAFADIQEAVTDLVDSAIRNVSSGAGRHPRYDLVDLGEQGYVLSFDLPGLEKSDVEVSAIEGEITISGTRPRPALPEGGEAIRSERSFGRFHRALRVPADVDVSGISARMTSGVLEISLPRKEDRETRHVEVE